MSRWDLYVTDRYGTRQALVDPYESAEIVARVNDVSTWTLTLPTDTAAGKVFTTDTFARFEVVLDAAVWRSGPATNIKRAVEIDGDTLTVSGVDDTVWLARRLAHPQPASAAPPYATTAYDVHTGTVAQVVAQLVDVNAGPGAVAARRVPGLTVPTPTPAGPTITAQARWNNLLTLCQDTVRPYALMFDVVDLAFRVYPTQDRGVVFSAGLETLAGWAMTTEAATANYVVVAGQGEGTARTIREQAATDSITTWGRVEAFVDQRQTADVAQLDKAATEALASGVKPVTVVFSPIDTPAQAFGHDWALGDTVTVVAGGLTVVDQVREVHVTLDDAGATVTPSVGQAAGDLALFRALAGLDRRVRQLERI
jgi:hypothetical protein